MIGVFLLTALAAEATEGSWLRTLRRVNTLADEQYFGSCNLQSSGRMTSANGEGGVCESAESDVYGVPYDTVATVFEASTRMVEEAPSYGLRATGDGAGTLSDQYRESSTVNCTSSLEALMNASIHGDSSWQTCWRDPVIRYLPGMEGSYFGRAHFYETEWRPNLLARGLVTEVTTCLTGGSDCAYDFRMDRSRFETLIQSQLGDTPSGKLFVKHLTGTDSALETSVTRLAAADCSALSRVDAALRLDWPGAPAARGSCANDVDRATLTRSYLTLVRDVRAQALEGLASRPVTMRTPCVATRGFDPDTHFPAAWRREGTVLMVAFMGADTTDRTKTMTRHQGLLVYRGGKWMVRHASSLAGRYVEEPLKDLLKRGTFSGMNFLAPRDSTPPAT
jgi:hypothetical protein